MSRPRFLVLGGGDGWHSNQLRDAAGACQSEIVFADYESLKATIQGHSYEHEASAGVSKPSPSYQHDAQASGSAAHRSSNRLTCSAGPLDQFDAVLTRTMPAGSLEQITFRLAVLHALAATGMPFVNPPRSLEIAIDKFATLAQVAALGYDVPATRVVQSRVAAMKAFDKLGGDCVVKPIFGGEGRGVMRVGDRQLAQQAFATLEQLNCVFYVQQFVPPGGRDTRLLVIGDRVFGVRRENEHDFRTNVSSGGVVRPAAVSLQQQELALRIAGSIGLRFASVDLIDAVDGSPKVLEVNAIPGWRGAQSVVSTNLAAEVVGLLRRSSRETAQQELVG